jgi:amphi-Trp domain-containing protein
MDILEVETKEKMSREEAAARLRTFADKLAQNNDIAFERGGMQFKVHVPDEFRSRSSSSWRRTSGSSRSS